MAIKKPTKKEWIYIGVLVALALLLWLLTRAKHVASAAPGNGADTYYLTGNIPPINSDGFTMPSFGDVNIPGVNLNTGGGGCNNCDQTPYYGSTQQLADALGGNGADAIQDALKSLPGYMTLNIQQKSVPGTINGVVWDTVTALPVLALGDGTTYSNMGEPAAHYAPPGISGGV